MKNCCLQQDVRIWFAKKYVMNLMGLYIFPQGLLRQPLLCYGDEENARIYAVHLTTANQSKMCRAHLALWRFLLGVIANGRRMEYNYGKTHDVGVEHGNQAEKTTLEANRHESGGKVGVGARW